MKSVYVYALIGVAQSLQLRADMARVEELQPHFQGYTPEYSGFEGNNHNEGQWRDAYERQVPEHLTGDTADTFTAKMVKDYAVEGQDEETGKPNGKFWVSHDKTMEAAKEVLSTHLNIKGAEQASYLNKWFDQVWDHMDVNKKGALEAGELNKFMRDLCKPVKEHITLQ